jgi:hypothetical protein
MSEMPSVQVRPFDMREVIVHALNNAADAIVQGNVPGFANTIDFIESLLSKFTIDDKDYMEGVNGAWDKNEKGDIILVKNGLVQDKEADLRELNKMFMVPDEKKTGLLLLDIPTDKAQNYTAMYNVIMQSYADKKFSYLARLMWKKGIFAKIIAGAEV